MIKIGDFNTLKIGRQVDFGVYLYDDTEVHRVEVLLPKRYIDSNMKTGDEITVFVYTDSEDRPVATTEKPYIRVGEFAFLQTVQINRVGAFMDWGLPKNLLVPFKEQNIKMFPGGIYLVYAYLDSNTGRVVASAKIEKFLGNVFPEYEKGDKVDILVIGRNEIGYIVIVDNMHRGIVYFNEIYKPIEIGQHYEAYVKNVRDEDGKIDVTFTAPGTLSRIEKISMQIMERLNDGTLSVSDISTPEEIKAEFHCSKKDFKKAVGMLYREKKIGISPDNHIYLPNR